MGRVAVDIEPANLETLGHDWREMGSEMAPQTGLWLPFIEEGKNAVLIARVIKTGQAVGTVAVKWSGPTKRSRAFRYHLNQIFEEGARRIPVSYGLLVSEDFRGQGIATGLMTGVEEQAALRQQEVEHLALSVREDNEGAISLYKKLGYETLTPIRHTVPVEWIEEENRYRGKRVTSWIMTKAL